jgi:hypothetical protein
MTPEQKAALAAAVDLVNGGLDLEESLLCYATLSDYVLNNPPKETQSTIYGNSATTD